MHKGKEQRSKTESLGTSWSRNKDQEEPRHHQGGPRAGECRPLRSKLPSTPGHQPSDGGPWARLGDAVESPVRWPPPSRGWKSTEWRKEWLRTTLQECPAGLGSPGTRLGETARCPEGHKVGKEGWKDREGSLGETTTTEDLGQERKWTGGRRRKGPVCQ